MRSYKITFAKSINRLVPHYIGGRKLILFLQSVLMPLQALNDTFSAWGKQTRIEACMTSQPILFIPFLNNMFSKYFANSEDSFSIENFVAAGTPVFPEANVKDEDAIIYAEKDDVGDDNLIVYYEGTSANRSTACSFAVYSPAINTSLISKEEYLILLNVQIRKYKLASKTYEIIMNES